MKTEVWEAPPRRLCLTFRTLTLTLSSRPPRPPHFDILQIMEHGPLI